MRLTERRPCFPVPAGRVSRRRLLAAIMLAPLLLHAPLRAGAAELEFPRDHGPHPDHRVEVWYFSGRLTADDGREFGFHLGFFRLGVRPDAAPAETPTRRSDWALNEVYRAELALADLQTGEFRTWRHVSRTALGLAGARAEPLRVWVYGWSVEASPGTPAGPGFRLRAAWGTEADLELELKVAKPAVSPGGQVPSDAAAWYSLTRMVAAGALKLNGRAQPVKGHAWLDRTWRHASFDQVAESLGAGEPGGFLTAGQIAVNRFALLLDNGWELWIFQTHRRDGSGTPVARGILVYGDGSTRSLGRDALVIEERGHWTGPGGVRYPAAWHVAVPEDGIDLEIKAAAPDQEVRGTVRYWAGALDLEGEAIGRPVTGQGHAALAGYDMRSGS